MRVFPEGRDSVGLIAIWALIGAALIVSTGTMLRSIFRDPQGWVGWVAAAIASPGPLLFFVVGVAAVGGSAYALFDKARNRMWLEVMAPVHLGGSLRARLVASRPLASARGQMIAADFACRHLIQRDEAVLWRERQEIPLAPAQASCDLGFELPQEERPDGAYWLLSLDVPALNAIRHFRIPVEPPAR